MKQIESVLVNITVSPQRIPKRHLKLTFLALCYYMFGKQRTLPSLKKKREENDSKGNYCNGYCCYCYYYCYYTKPEDLLFSLIACWLLGIYSPIGFGTSVITEVQCLLITKTDKVLFNLLVIFISISLFV